MIVTKAQVAKGAKMLDEKVPGWADKINTKKLVMRNNTNCILGQLAQYVGYGKNKAIEYGEDQLGLTEKKFASHGFEAAGDFPDPESDKAQAELWKAEITARIPEAASPGPYNFMKTGDTAVAEWQKMLIGDGIMGLAFMRELSVPDGDLIEVLVIPN